MIKKNSVGKEKKRLQNGSVNKIFYHITTGVIHMY